MRDGCGGPVAVEQQRPQFRPTAPPLAARGGNSRRPQRTRNVPPSMRRILIRELVGPPTAKCRTETKACGGLTHAG